MKSCAEIQFFKTMQWLFVILTSIKIWTLNDLVIAFCEIDNNDNTKLVQQRKLYIKIYLLTRPLHSHKKRKDSLKTRAVLIEICYVEIYRAAQNTGDHFKKTWLFLKGISCLQVGLRTNLDETSADMVQFTKRWNWKWIV